MANKLRGDAIVAGSVDVSIPAVLRKSADSLEQTGKVAADMTLSYWREGGTRTAITASDLAAVNSAHSDGGVKEVDATNMPGTYRLDLPDAAVATGADWVVVAIKIASTFMFLERFDLIAEPLSADVTKLNGDATAAAKLAVSAGTMLTVTFATGTLSTTHATTDLTVGLELNGAALIFRAGGAGPYQRTRIIGNVGASGLIHYEPVAIAPANGDTGVVV